MPLHRPLLLVAVALAGATLVMPAAKAGSGDVQAVRAAAISYSHATLYGSPEACQMMTPAWQKGFAYVASEFTKTKLTSCPAAVEAMAKMNESQYPNRQAYLGSGVVKRKALAAGKVTLDGSDATLDFTIKQGFVSVGSSMTFVRVHGRWLFDG